MRKSIVIISIIIILVFSLMACSKETLTTPEGEDYTNYKQISYSSLEFFGTTTYLVLGQNFKDKLIKDQADYLWEDVQSALRTLDNQINENIKTSDIYKFNTAKAGEQIEINKYTYDLLLICREIYLETNGKFNPAVGHLIDLWGFTPRFTSVEYKKIMPYDRDNYKIQLPDVKYIEGFNKLTNFNDVKVFEENNKYYVLKPANMVKIDGIEYSMKISLGGIGKGYATDIANKLIKEKFNFGYISIGGSSMAINRSIKPVAENPLDWKVGIAHPRKDQDRYLNLYLSDKSLSTSGDYERYYEIDGKRYCHIINSDGYPITTNMVTATVVGKSSAMCDALSTAISCMSLDEAKEFLDSEFVKDNKLQIYFLYNNNNTYELNSNSECELVDTEYKKI